MSVLSQRSCALILRWTATLHFLRVPLLFSNEELTVSLVEYFQRQRCEWDTT